MRTSMAYLAGAGTVVTAIAAGLGGGLLIAEIMSPHAPKQEMSKLERRAAPEPSASTRDPLVPVPYLAATQASSNGPVVVSPASQNAQPALLEANNSSPPAAQTSDVTASNDQAAKSPDASKPEASKSETSKPETSKSEASKSEASKLPEAPASKPSSPAVQPAVSVPDDAYAKARDADMKRAERRKSERRQQWADRRRTQQSREQELRDVEEKVRAETEPRDDDERPVRVEYPQVRLFRAE
jgi:hypothetical protein